MTTLKDSFICKVHIVKVTANVFFIKKIFFWAVVSGFEPQLNIGFSIAVKIEFSENLVVKGFVF